MTRIRHTWVNGSGRALAVRIDLPASDSCVGAVVLAPTVSNEAVVSFRTMRALAVRAAERGLVSVSFSFSGDGDSEGIIDVDDLVSAWVADLKAIVDFARDFVVGPVNIVGLRLGASLADRVPLGEGETRVLWEPVSGRAFVRRHEALRKLSITQPVELDGVELDGLLLKPEQAESLRSLQEPRQENAGSSDGPRDRRILVRETDRQIADKFISVSPHFAEIPYPSLDRVLDLLTTAAGGIVKRSVLPVAVELTNGSGQLVCEEHVVIGPNDLPGIRTWSPSMTPTRSMSMTAMGAGLRCGPSGLWALAARDLAPRGVTSLRADRRELGECLNVSRPSEPPVYTDESVSDVAEAVQYLRQSTALPVTAVGVCAGAWSFLNASAQVPIEHVIAVNTIDWNPDARRYDDAFYSRAFAAEAAAGLAIPDSLYKPSQKSTMGAWHQRVIDRRRELGTRFPTMRAWKRRDYRRDRVGWLLDVVPTRTRVSLVMGKWEYVRFVGYAGPRDVRRVNRRGGRVDVRVMDIDHPLLAVSSRRQVLDLLQRLA